MTREDNGVIADVHDHPNSSAAGRDAGNAAEQKHGSSTHRPR
jgi:uncharacterized protein YfiM (DUF2279 family)